MREVTGRRGPALHVRPTPGTPGPRKASQPVYGSSGGTGYPLLSEGCCTGQVAVDAMEFGEWLVEVALVGVCGEPVFGLCLACLPCLRMSPSLGVFTGVDVTFRHSAAHLDPSALKS